MSLTMSVTTRPTSTVTSTSTTSISTVTSFSTTSISASSQDTTVAETLISTETVTQTGLLTSSGASINSNQTGVSATATSSGSTTVSSKPTTPPSNSRSLQLGPIVGGVVAVLALVLIFIFLLLKHRASQREIRLRAEIDSTPTTFNLDTREGPGRYVSVNDDGSRSKVSRSTVYSSQVIPPVNGSSKRARTNYTVHSPIHDERIHLASGYSTSNLNPQAGGLFQSNSSYDLITNGAITEEITHTPTHIPGQSANKTHLQTDSTYISTDSDYASNSAPPAYDSLPTRISRRNAG